MCVFLFVDYMVVNEIRKKVYDIYYCDDYKDDGLDLVLKEVCDFVR